MLYVVLRQSCLENIDVEETECFEVPEVMHADIIANPVSSLPSPLTRNLLDPKTSPNHFMAR